RITSLSFHPNYNSLILSSSSDKTCAVWSTGEESVRIDRNDLILIGEQQKKKQMDQLEEKEKEKDKNVGQNIDRIQDRNERGWSFGQENKKTELINRNWYIKGGNILLHNPSGSGRIILKIAGFQEVKIMNKIDNAAFMLQRGTLPYMPPEILLGDQYELIEADAQLDIWSLGILVYLMTTHTFPFNPYSVQSIRQFLSGGVLVRPSSITDDLLWDLLVRMLAFDRKNRITAVDALKHPFFTSEQAMREITQEQRQLAKTAQTAQQRGDQNISKFDINPLFVFPLAEVQKILSPINPQAEMIQQNPQQQTSSSLTIYPQDSNASLSTQQPGSTFITTWKLSDFEQKERLGKGSFGVVRHIIEIRTSRHMACKEMDYDEEDEKINVEREKKQIFNATRILRQSPITRSLTQLPIVELLGFFVSEDGRKAYLVMEYCSGGDLRKYINNMKKMGVAINPEKAWEIVAQIAFSLYQLHSSGIIHADLKPENILLTEEFKVKLSDFGLARQLQVDREYTTNHGGTFLYQGPELHRTAGTDESNPTGGERRIPQRIIQTVASDIWSFGVMMFELLAQRHPFFDNKNPERRITAEAILQLPEVAAILRTN
ncbi:MAG: putative NEK protein kinase, partial [Streblomastix strix]